MNLIIQKDIEEIVNQISGLERFRGKTVLIAGANGMLPAYMVETLIYLNLLKINFNVKVIALVRNKLKTEKRFKHLLGDHNLLIIEQDVCIDLNLDEKIDFIIHAASQASPRFYGIDPVGTLSANILGTINLIKLAKKNNVESFLFFSSGEVYGQVEEKDIPISEDTFGYLNPAKVRSCYAESKRMGENICVSWFHQFGVKAKIVRPFHTYGPGMSLDDGRVFADFVSDIVRNKNIEIMSDGKAIRPYCYISDAVIAFFTILLKGEDGEAYNVGNPNGELSVIQLANLLLGIFPEKQLKVQFIEKEINKNYLQSPILRNCPDINKIAQLDWAPKILPEDGFKRTILSFI